MLVLAFAISALSLAEPPPPVVELRQIPPALTEADRRYPVGPLPSDWPSAGTGRPIVAPDWSDYRIYPAAAALREEEGRVRIALRVGADGQPRACRVTEASGHVELDDGTCDLAMTMRFAAVDNGSAERFYTVRLNWELTDPIALAPARAVARLDLDGGRVTSCRLEPGSGIPSGWTRDLCPTFSAQPGYFLGAALAGARHAAIVTSLRPTGDRAPAPPPPAGRLVAMGRTEFDVAANGDFVHCRTAATHGFGIARNAYWGACGPGLIPLWFEPPAEAGTASGGAVEISVYVDD